MTPKEKLSAWLDGRPRSALGVEDIAPPSFAFDLSVMHAAGAMEEISRYSSQAKEASELRRRESESAALRAQIEQHCYEKDRLKGQVNRLEAECEQLRADAARYRWLVEMEMLDQPSVGMANAFKKYTGSALDAAIDAAMKETK